MKPIMESLRATASEPDRATPESLPAEERPVALISFHGIGQQVRYGTLEETIQMLFAGAERIGGKAELSRRRQENDHDRLVACAEMKVELGSRRVPVHVYEVYWAPLTEGRISARETFWFLFNAARNSAINGRKFTRFLFETKEPAQGEKKQASIGTIPALILAALTMVALWVFDAVFLAVIASTILIAGEPSWFETLRRFLLADYAAALFVPIASILLFVAGPFWLKPLRERARWAGPLRVYAQIGNLGLRFTALWMVVVAADVLVLCLTEAMRHGTAGPPTGLPVLSLVPGLDDVWLRVVGPFADSRAWLLAFGLTVFIATNTVRRFIREYVGDVAIYVSSHQVNRFHETRAAIQKEACDLVRFVFGRLSSGPKSKHLYEHIVLLGHSLGSVIAYDTLNRLLLDDAADGETRKVKARTSALITYGSPLDKTAFVFRTQRRKDGSLREAMSAARQPLIEDPEARAHYWVNVYSPFDWIGGDLDFYDPKGGPPAPAKPVINIEDPHARTPLAAHGEHLEGSTLQRLVAQAVLGELAENEHVRKVLGPPRAAGVIESRA